MRCLPPPPYWAGIFTMAVGLSAVQTVLAEGNKDDRIASSLILRLAYVALVSLCGDRGDPRRPRRHADPQDEGQWRRGALNENDRCVRANRTGRLNGALCCTQYSSARVFIPD